MSQKVIEVIEPGCKAKTNNGNIDGFITAVKIGKGPVIYYEFSYFSNNGYEQMWIEEFEFQAENDKKLKFGFKQ